MNTYPWKSAYQDMVWIIFLIIVDWNTICIYTLNIQTTRYSIIITKPATKQPHQHFDKTHEHSVVTLMYQLQIMFFLACMCVCVWGWGGGVCVCVCVLFCFVFCFCFCFCFCFFCFCFCFVLFCFVLKITSIYKQFESVKQFGRVVKEN